MGQLKEADFLRWGNTKRMTGLRKAEQDGMWEGIKERVSPFLSNSQKPCAGAFAHAGYFPPLCFPSPLPTSPPHPTPPHPADNFDDYWRVASKITPTTLPARPGSPAAAQPSMHIRPPSADPQGAPDRDGAYNVRSVPIRLYLPEGPVLQDLAPPVLEDGASSTSIVVLLPHGWQGSFLPVEGGSTRARAPLQPRSADFFAPADDPMLTQVRPIRSRIYSRCICRSFFQPRVLVLVRRSHTRYFKG